MDELTFGEKVRIAIKQLDVTQSDVAKAIGISQPVISDIVNGKHTSPSLRIIKGLAEYLNVSSDYLIGVGLVSELGERIKIELIRKQRSQTELARDTGIPLPTLGNILSGVTQNPGVRTIAKIARYLGVSVDYLIKED